MISLLQQYQATIILIIWSVQYVKAAEKWVIQGHRNFCFVIPYFLNSNTLWL